MVRRHGSPVSIVLALVLLTLFVLPGCGSASSAPSTHPIVSVTGWVGGLAFGVGSNGQPTRLSGIYISSTSCEFSCPPCPNTTCVKYAVDPTHFRPLLPSWLADFGSTPTDPVKVWYRDGDSDRTILAIDIPYNTTSAHRNNLHTTEEYDRANGAANIKEVYLPQGTVPGSIVAGPDGNLWFTEFKGKVGRITPQGQLAEFPLTRGRSPFAITLGPDGNLWFTETGLASVISSAIGRITPQGTLTEFALKSGDPVSITTGPDGNLWFTEASAIGQITPQGAVEEFPLASFSDPAGIVMGPDGNLWFGESGATKRIARMTTAGVVTEFLLTTGSQLTAIVKGPDGNLWATAHGSTGGVVDKITPQGTITEYPIAPNSDPSSIVVGRDGNLWFTDDYGSIGRITLQGAITFYPVPVGDCGLTSLTVGPDGNLWFTERAADKIGELIT